MAGRNVAMREAIRRALQEEMRRDENVFVMGEEVAYWQGTHRVTRGFLEEFGERRVRDTPISEMAIGGVAVGAAMAGLRPVAEFMTINFAFWPWTRSPITRARCVTSLMACSKCRWFTAPRAAGGTKRRRRIRIVRSRSSRIFPASMWAALPTRWMPTAC